MRADPFVQYYEPLVKYVQSTGWTCPILGSLQFEHSWARSSLLSYWIRCSFQVQPNGGRAMAWKAWPFPWAAPVNYLLQQRQGLQVRYYFTQCLHAFWKMLDAQETNTTWTSKDPQEKREGTAFSLSIIERMRLYSLSSPMSQDELESSSRKHGLCVEET